MSTAAMIAILERMPAEQRAQLIDAMCDRDSLLPETREAMHALLRAIEAVEEAERKLGRPMPLDVEDPLVEELADHVPKRRPRN